MSNSPLFAGEVVTLDQLLAHKEALAHRVEALCQTYRQPVLCFKLNIPGPVKASPGLTLIFEEGLLALREALNPLEQLPIAEKIILPPSGAVYFAVFQTAHTPHETLKRLTVAIEETHPLGRLFDFDWHLPKGGQLSREALGLPTRRCLVCDQEAFVCGRSRAHALEDLQTAITTQYEQFQALKNPTEGDARL